MQRQNKTFPDSLRNPKLKTKDLVAIAAVEVRFPLRALFNTKGYRYFCSPLSLLEKRGWPLASHRER